MKKSLKLSFCGKKWGPNQWCCTREKSSKSLKKFFFEKKIFQLIFADMIFKTVCGNFFFDKWVTSNLSFGRFKVLKNCSSQKTINKNWSTKNQENSTHRFGDDYPINHLIKFRQDRIKPWRVGALKVCTGYHFFWTKSLVRVF